MPGQVHSFRWSVVRPVLLVWLATGASTLAHAGVGGHLPGPLVTAFMILGLSVLCAPLAQRSLTLGRATGLLAGLQIVVHVLSTELGAAGAANVPIGQAAGADALAAGHGQMARHAGATAELGLAASAGGIADVLPSWPMLAAHAAAALLLGWALASGERGFALASRCWSDLPRAASRMLALSLVFRLLRRLIVWAGTGVAGARPIALFRWDAPRLPQLLWSRRRPARRGPPSFLIA